MILHICMYLEIKKYNFPYCQSCNVLLGDVWDIHILLYAGLQIE